MCFIVLWTPSPSWWPDCAAICAVWTSLNEIWTINILIFLFVALQLAGSFCWQLWGASCWTWKTLAQTKTTFKWQSLVHWYVIMTNCSRQKRYSVSSSLQPEIVSDSVSRSRSYCKSNWPTCQLQVDWELASFPRRLGSSSCSQEHRHLSFATVTLYTKICVLIISVPSQGYILWWHWDL